jgi:uncharacterized membrane protein
MESALPAISNLGIVHIAISLVALGAGIRALARYTAITGATPAGLLYIVMTLLTCVSGFFMFSGESFGGPQALGLLTLATVGVAAAARAARAFGDASAAVETVAYSLTFYLLLIPALTETATRLPPDSPFAAGADSPALQALAGAMFVMLLIGALLQVRRLRDRERRQRELRTLPA